MKYLLPLSIIFALVAIACGKKEEQKTTIGLQHEMKSFRLESNGGCKSDSSWCASYEVEYPVFNNLSLAVSDSLNRKISASLDTGNPAADTVSLEISGKTFINDFEKAKVEFPDERMGWHYKATVNVNLVTDTLISLKSVSQYFTGGAHGGSGIFFININPSTGESIKLINIFKPGFRESLNAMAEKEFRKSLEFSDTTSFADQGFEFPDDRFQLNENFGFTKHGIVFAFNIYEIGPYALGAREILIPYNEIKALLE